MHCRLMQQHAIPAKLKSVKELSMAEPASRSIGYRISLACPCFLYFLFIFGGPFFSAYPSTTLKQIIAVSNSKNAHQNAFSLAFRVSAGTTFGFDKYFHRFMNMMYQKKKSSDQNVFFI